MCRAFRKVHHRVKICKGAAEKKFNKKLRATIRIADAKAAIHSSGSARVFVDFFFCCAFAKHFSGDAFLLNALHIEHACTTYS